MNLLLAKYYFWISSVLYHLEFFNSKKFYLFWFVLVQFWREVRSSTVHKDGAESRSICSSPHWTLCLCRMEFRVLNFIIINICFCFLIFSLYIDLQHFLIWLRFSLWHRGFPVWLKYVPGISFRTDNGPFKVKIFSCKIFKWEKINDRELMLKILLIFFLFPEGGNARVHPENCSADEGWEAIWTTRWSNHSFPGVAIHIYA